MTRGVHAESNALEEFRRTIKQNQIELEGALEAARYEYGDLMEELRAGIARAELKVRDCEEQVQRAERRLSNCEDAYFESSDSHPDCSAEEQALSEARRRLENAQDRLDQLRNTERNLESAGRLFEADAVQLELFVSEEIVRGDTFLQKKVEDVIRYGVVSLQQRQSLTSASGNRGKIKISQNGALNKQQTIGNKNITPKRLAEIHQEANQLAKGHAFDKHVVQRKEFPEIKTQRQFAMLIAKVIIQAKENNRVRLNGGRAAYWDDRIRMVVITNPKGEGTAFRPDQDLFPGRSYFDKLKVNR